MDADARLDAAVGSVAEEATRLLEALGRPQSRRDEGSAPPEDPDEPGHEEREHVHVAMGEAESCTWCPVCRSVTALRGVSPETLARLADLATAAATVLADLAGRHTESDEPSAQRSSTSERTPRTEPITVVDEEDTP